MAKMARALLAKLAKRDPIRLSPGSKVKNLIIVLDVIAKHVMQGCT